MPDLLAPAICVCRTPKGLHVRGVYLLLYSISLRALSILTPLEGCFNQCHHGGVSGNIQ